MTTYRHTMQKEAVMTVLRTEMKHLTAEQVYKKIHITNPMISRSTVFRILNQLSDRGHILRIRVPNGADCYDCKTMPHYHIRCVECQRIADLDMPILENIEDNIINTHGFNVLGHSLIFSGICPECKLKERILD